MVALNGDTHTIVLREDKEMASTTVGKLTATDRKSLTKITEGRFEVLQEQLSQRLNEIKSLARERIVREHKADIDTYTLKARSLADEKVALDHRYEQDKADLERKQQLLDQDALNKGIKITRDRYGSTFKVHPANIEAAVNEDFADILKGYNAAKLNLRTMKLEIQEKIAVSGLETDEAQKFLANIPSIDNLLPAPEDIPELQKA